MKKLPIQKVDPSKARGGIILLAVEILGIVAIIVVTIIKLIEG